MSQPGGVVLASEESKALALDAQKAIRRINRKVVRKALRRLEDAADLAMAIDDDGRAVPEPDRLIHVAKDLRKSKRNAPYYIDVLVRRDETAQKIAAARDEGVPLQLNIGTVQIVAPQYPRLKLPETKE